MSLEKIDVRDIFRDQARTYVDWSSGKPSTSDRLVHWGIPVAAFSMAAEIGVHLSRDAVGLSITALAVIVSLLFNLLVTASSLRIAQKGSVIFGEARELSKQILVNIEYAIVIAFMAIAIVMPSLLPAPAKPAWLVQVNGWLQLLVGPAFVGLLVAFALALLMVLRRMHVALTKNLELTYETGSELQPRKRFRDPETRIANSR